MKYEHKHVNPSSHYNSCISLLCLLTVKFSVCAFGGNQSFALCILWYVKPEVCAHTYSRNTLHHAYYFSVGFNSYQLLNSVIILVFKNEILNISLQHFFLVCFFEKWIEILAEILVCTMICPLTPFYLLVVVEVILCI